MAAYLISMICAGFTGMPPNYGVACDRGMTAFAIQTGAQKSINLIEEHTRELAEQYVPVAGKTVLSTGYGIYQQNVKLEGGFKPIADQYTFQVQKDSMSVTFSWAF